jgi:hypothetical protein
MKRISIRIGVALVAFFVGFVASTIRLRFSVGSPKSAFSTMSSRDEEWHRLYEAAGMSGDGTIIKEVSDRLLCANKAGVPDASPLDIECAVWCQRADGTIHQLLVNDTSEYGSFFRRITSSHSTWALENLDFAEQSALGRRQRHTSLLMNGPHVSETKPTSGGSGLACEWPLFVLWWASRRSATFGEPMFG